MFTKIKIADTPVLTSQAGDLSIIGFDNNWGVGGNLVLTAGYGWTNGGSHVKIQGGNGFLWGIDGGNIYVCGGLKNGASNDGNVILCANWANQYVGNVGIGLNSSISSKLHIKEQTASTDVVEKLETTTGTNKSVVQFVWGGWTNSEVYGTSSGLWLRSLLNNNFINFATTLSGTTSDCLQIKNDGTINCTRGTSGSGANANLLFQVNGNPRLNIQNNDVVTICNNWWLFSSTLTNTL